MNFVKGYYHLNEDVSLNFQLNRWLTWIGGESFNDLETLGKKVKNYEQWIEEFLKLADDTLEKRELNKAAYYYRAAEFFMLREDKRKKAIRNKFVSLKKEVNEVSESNEFKVPYKNGFLPGYKFFIDKSSPVIVIFGGFDSYIEELLFLKNYLNDRGYNVVFFDGPGQGGALEDYDIKLEKDWQNPVKCVLDFLNLDEVILLGLSLGGELVIQAAAFEKRVKYVIADDAMFDFLECNLKQVNIFLRILVKLFLSLKLAPIINILFRFGMKRSFIFSWGVNQGMHITGASSPYSYLKKIKELNVKKASKLLNQHVLLLAGAEDHYIPLEMFYKQIESLKNAASVTGKIFTKAESAQNHCHVGNIKLSIDFIINWMDFMTANK
jgi:pimeloyl-ACP methyl ester carboxylesterase